MKIQRKHKLKALDNWCHSYLRIVCFDADEPQGLEQFETAAVGHSPWMKSKGKARQKPCQLNFHSLVAIPKRVLKAGYNPTGRNWEITNWGAEGGASLKGDPAGVQGGFTDSENFLDYPFDTPSTPPIAFLQKVSRAWPSLTFLLAYDHRTNCFKGIARAKAGRVRHHRMGYTEMNQMRKETSNAKPVR